MRYHWRPRDFRLWFAAAASDYVDVGYTTIFPSMTIIKVIAAQLVVVFRGHGGLTRGGACSAGIARQATSPPRLLSRAASICIR